MIARTKLQKRIVEYSSKLPPLTPYQRRLAIKNTAPHLAKLSSKGQYTCLECGYTWKGPEMVKVKCPDCGYKLDVNKGRQYRFREKFYFSTITCCNEFQVIRTFILDARLYKGKKAEYVIDEVFQRWIMPTGQSHIIGLKRNVFCWYQDSWLWNEGFELRAEHYVHSLNPYYVLPRQNVSAILKRNGYEGNLHGANPHYLLRALLTDNYVETLWKAHRYDLAIYFSHSNRADRYWPALKIVIRNQYHIEDTNLWCDMVSTLMILGKDIHNPKYVCPDDLKKSHDHWAAKLQEHHVRKKEQEEKLRIKQYEPEYQKLKSKFFDLEFVGSNFVIKPLTSVKEFYSEGHHMHHCVFINRYYTKQDSLIFHALVDGVSVATIEFNLETLEIIQCRGLMNSVPMYDQEIRSLILSNKHLIAKRIGA